MEDVTKPKPFKAKKFNVSGHCRCNGRSMGMRGEMPMKPKRLSISIPFEIWKKLNLMRIDGKIKSIQDAVINGLKALIKAKS